MSEKVFALTYEHRHGADLSLWATEAGAVRSLAETAREWWSEAVENADPDDGIPTDPPADDERAVELYFMVMGEDRNVWEPESYRIEGLEVQT